MRISSFAIEQAMVWGASAGLGLAIAECLAEEGASTVLVARSGQRLDQAVARITAKGGKAAAIASDIGDWQSVERSVGSMRAMFGDPDILINNSGGPPTVDVTHVDAPLWQSQFEAMVLNQMRITAAVLPAMRAKKFRRIISHIGHIDHRALRRAGDLEFSARGTRRMDEDLGGRSRQGRRDRQSATPRKFCDRARVRSRSPCRGAAGRAGK